MGIESHVVRPDDAPPCAGGEEVPADGPRVEAEDRTDVLEREQRSTIPTLEPLLRLDTEQPGKNSLRDTPALEPPNGILEDREREAQFTAPRRPVLVLA